MNQTNVLTGTRNAPLDRASSPSAPIVAVVPTRVIEVLERLENQLGKAMPMLRTACGILATYLATSIDTLTLLAVFNAKDSLRPYLAGRKYAENSIRTYVNQVKALLNAAMQFGWGPSDAVPPTWRPLVDSVGSVKVRRSLLAYLMNIRATPLEVTDEDVAAWTHLRVKEGDILRTPRSAAGWFWRSLKNLGWSAARAKSTATRYRVPVDQFPEPLKSEVRALLQWKQAEFSPGRPSKGKHRSISVKSLERVICQLYGYALNVRHECDIHCLADLIQERVLTGFVEWRINERHTGGYGNRIGLAMIKAALRHHPVHRSLDLTWFDTLLDSIPQESESEFRRRKAAKFLEYSVIEQIPNQIHEDRLKLRASSTAASQLVMGELLMYWLSVLPWRQRNIRECRVTGPEPNLFKAKIPPSSELKKPAWVVLEQQKNPAAEFWQFRFTPGETKTKVTIHALLPKQLLPLLEEYLSEHRPALLRGNSCDTLFVNRCGGPMDETLMGQEVGTLTLRYAGRRVSPHRFRDIVAYAWLDAHPEDFLRLSKLLWHRDVNTTIRIYGARFNESNGVCAMEEWLDERKARSSSK